MAPRNRPVVDPSPILSPFTVVIESGGATAILKRGKLRLGDEDVLEDRGWQNFPMKQRIVNNLGFWGPVSLWQPLNSALRPESGQR